MTTPGLYTVTLHTELDSFSTKLQGSHAARMKNKMQYRCGVLEPNYFSGLKSHSMYFRMIIRETFMQCIHPVFNHACVSRFYWNIKRNDQIQHSWVMLAQAMPHAQFLSERWPNDPIPCLQGDLLLFPWSKCTPTTTVICTGAKAVSY